MAKINIIESIMWKVKKQHYSASIEDENVFSIWERCTNVFDIEFKNGIKRITNPLEVNFKFLTSSEYEKHEQKIKDKYNGENKTNNKAYNPI